MSDHNSDTLDALLRRLYAKEHDITLEDDEAFQESLRSVEEESDEAILGTVGIDDAERLEQLFPIEGPRAPRAPRKEEPTPPPYGTQGLRSLTATVSVAAAVLGVFFITSLPSMQKLGNDSPGLIPTGEITVHVQPRRSRKRSPHQSGEVARVTPATRMRFDFKQRLDQQTTPAHRVVPYIVQSDGRLQKVDMRVGSETDQHLATLYAEGDASDVLGLIPGRRIIVFAFAGPKGASSLEGRRWSQVRNDPTVRTTQVVIEYETGPVASLHNYARIVNKDGGRVRVFDHKHLPVVRLRSTAERPLRLRLQWDHEAAVDLPADVVRQGEWTLVKVSKGDHAPGVQGFLTLYDDSVALQKWRVGWMSGPHQYNEIKQAQALDR